MFSTLIQRKAKKLAATLLQDHGRKLQKKLQTDYKDSLIFSSRASLWSESDSILCSGTITIFLSGRSDNLIKSFSVVTSLRFLYFFFQLKVLFKYFILFVLRIIK